ncbi:MAG TPA: choice-of-anchor Q domain-containing protein [Solirubrobacterales bacterium]|nr:choice-of-anchor Q domain-containing protein [Solirubrobacterales bacterium]
MATFNRCLALAILGLLAILPGSAGAAKFTVTRTADPPPNGCKKRDCSLREAVIAANARPGVDRIVLKARKRPYRLTRTGTGENEGLDGDLDLDNDPIAIVGRGKRRTTIDGSASGERIFEAFAPTRLRRLILTGGRESEHDGGAIHASANLTIAASVLRGNAAPEVPPNNSGLGGAIYHQAGVLRILGSKLIGNRAGDEAGAIEATGDRFVIRRSVLRGNRADASRAGAIYAATDQPSLIDKTTFRGNSAPNTGGALYVNNGSVRVASSTFSANRSTDDNGGAIHSFGELTVVNSTFSGNRATGFGGAIFNGTGATALLNATTIARNVSDSDGNGIGSGGGAFNAPAGEFRIRNSILALNDQRLGDADDCAGVFTSAGGNLRTDGTDCGGFDSQRDTVRANPRLRGLARNGGPTATIALKRKSPAIGRAIRASAPRRDQRGRQRDRRPDSGAYELVR